MLRTVAGTYRQECEPLAKERDRRRIIGYLPRFQMRRDLAYGRPKPINLNFKDKLELQGRCDMSTILIIVLLILLLGGGGYYGHSRYGGAGLGGVLGLVLTIAVVVWLVGAIG
jgi:hypothetical protein